MSKRLSRICTLVVAIVLCFSMASTAFATTEFSNVAPVAPYEEGIMPMDLTELLHIDWANQGYTGSKFYSVTPTKGTNMKMVCRNNFQFSSTLTVKVYKDGAVLATKTLYIDAGTSATSYDLVNNCNGKPYKIEIFSNVMAQYYAVIVQTDYI